MENYTTLIKSFNHINSEAETSDETTLNQCIGGYRTCLLTIDGIIENSESDILIDQVTSLKYSILSNLSTVLIRLHKLKESLRIDEVLFTVEGGDIRLIKRLIFCYKATNQLGKTETLIKLLKTKYGIYDFRLDLNLRDENGYEEDYQANTMHTDNSISDNISFSELNSFHDAQESQNTRLTSYHKHKKINSHQIDKSKIPNLKLNKDSSDNTRVCKTHHHSGIPRINNKKVNQLLNKKNEINTKSQNKPLIKDEKEIEIKHEKSNSSNGVSIFQKIKYGVLATSFTVLAIYGLRVLLKKNK